MTEPKRIRLSRKKGWKMPPNTVKVDRSTPWGNPFITSKHGTQERCVELFTCAAAGLIALGYDTCGEQEALHQRVRENISDLTGKNLACWCREGTPCHAEVLLELANDPEEKFNKRLAAIFEKGRRGCE